MKIREVTKDIPRYQQLLKDLITQVHKYIIILLCALVYSCILLYALVYCCTLLYIDIYSCILTMLLFTFILYCTQLYSYCCRLCIPLYTLVYPCIFLCILVYTFVGPLSTVRDRSCYQMSKTRLSTCKGIVIVYNFWLHLHYDFVSHRLCMHLLVLCSRVALE